MKTENSCEFVDLLYIVVYILDAIKFSFTEFSFTEFRTSQKEAHYTAVAFTSLDS